MGIVQLAERQIVALDVVGSSPTTHPIGVPPVSIGVSPSGKARDFDSRIRRFKSYHPCHECDPLAQPVEHLTFNQGVRSSNLRWITNKNATVAELADAPDLGSGLNEVGVQVSSVAPTAGRLGSRRLAYKHH